MSDLIDRQAAIDALDVLCQEHRYKIPGKLETYSQYNEAWQDALDRAEGAIGNLPSVRPVDKDINVSCKDAISRQDAIDAVDKLSDKPIGYLESAIDVLVDLPSVQPDIIACGDCKHYIPHDKRCGYWNHGVQPLMWCSQAERWWKE